MNSSSGQVMELPETMISMLHIQAISSGLMKTDGFLRTVSGNMPTEEARM